MEKELKNNQFGDMETGISLYMSGLYDEAYICFFHADADDPATLFDLALCYIHSREYEKAIQAIRKAKQNLSMLSRKTVSIPYKLQASVKTTDAYKAVMTSEEAKLFPAKCLIRMQRVEADLLYETGRFDELDLLIQILHGKGYGNIVKMEEELRNKRMTK